MEDNVAYYLVFKCSAFLKDKKRLEENYKELIEESYRKIKMEDIENTIRTYVFAKTNDNVTNEQIDISITKIVNFDYNIRVYSVKDEMYLAIYKPSDRNKLDHITDIFVNELQNLVGKKKYNYLNGSFNLSVLDKTTNEEAHYYIKQRGE